MNVVNDVPAATVGFYEEFKQLVAGGDTKLQTNYGTIYLYMEGVTEGLVCASLKPFGEGGTQVWCAMTARGLFDAVRAAIVGLPAEPKP